MAEIVTFGNKLVRERRITKQNSTVGT